MKEFIVVTRFEEYQQYKDGRPIRWIKLYLSLLDNYDFCKLPDASKWHLVGLMLLAGKHNNRIPADPAFLAIKLSCKSVNISVLLDAGFIAYESVRNSTLTQEAAAPRVEKSREEESREEKKREEGNGEGATAPPSSLLTFGEFSRVQLTPEQHGKLLAKMNGSLTSYITDFDRWVNESPDAKDKSGIRRKDRHPYESIASWYDRDAKAGTVKTAKRTHVHTAICRDQACGYE